MSYLRTKERTLTLENTYGRLLTNLNRKGREVIILNLSSLSNAGRKRFLRILEAHDDLDDVQHRFSRSEGIPWVEMTVRRRGLGPDAYRRLVERLFFDLTRQAETTRFQQTSTRKRRVQKPHRHQTRRVVPIR